ncbi:uncharacterized protein LOC143364948 [Halictus rubicundus]|uniref:uncharacterized protein LOC143364948 n=1 Tax=Halictus rubicundus TaxID=77578 RepID=UPI004035CF69
MTDPLAPGNANVVPLAGVARVAIKIPPFWEKNPRIWFQQLESQFVLSGITQDVTKYHYVTANLENKYADVVVDYIGSPPESNMYETLKTELIRRIADSKEQDIRNLLEHEEIGDRKPSVFLRRLQGLAAGAVTDEFLKTLWMARLPTNVQTVLVTRRRDPLSDLAALADAVIEVSSRAQVNAASTSRMDETQALIAELRREIAALRVGMDTRRARSKSRGPRERRASKSRSRSDEVPPGDGRCWYHWKHGPAARKCRDPCSQAAENRRDGR